MFFHDRKVSHFLLTEANEHGQGIKRCFEKQRRETGR